jgi:hypothetical protein
MKNNSYFIFLVFFLMTFILGCDKLDLKWNLEKVSKPPIIESSTIISISNTGATVEVKISNDGGDTILSRGVCYSVSPNPTISSSVSYNTSGLMTFSAVLSGLSPNTTYYARGFASNSNGVSYSDELIFTTTNISVVLPTVTTNTPSSISANSVNFSGSIVADGGSAITNSGFCYSTNQFPTLAGLHTVGGLSLGTFNSVISNLTSNTTYYVRAYASNSIGTSYGNQISFTTISNVASNIGNNDCSSLSGINSLYYGYNGTSDEWGIDFDMAYNGGCFIAPKPNNFGYLGSTYGSNHFVEFNKNFNSQGYMEFWVNTYNPGQNNLIPTIIINGNSIGNAIMIGGAANSFSWMKVRTPIIPAGFNNIKISFNATYIPLRVDEVSFYEY